MAPGRKSGDEFPILEVEARLVFVDGNRHGEDEEGPGVAGEHRRGFFTRRADAGLLPKKLATIRANFVPCMNVLA
jgi:hypothetical protein